MGTMTADEAVSAIAGANRGIPPEDQGLLEAALIAIDHVDDSVRLEAARLLASSHDPRAHAALDARWADPRGPIATIAVRAGAFRDLAGLWHRFLPHIQAVLDRRSDTPTDEAIVAKLLYVCHGEPEPLVTEPRLLDLAARLRRHRVVGAAARMALEAAPRGAALAAIERYPYEPPLLARMPPPERRDYVARYRAGEHAVWDELVEHALAVAQHADLRLEAYAVACELMTRVRASLAVEARPAGDTELAPLTTRFGRLPIALEALWRIVGSIDLRPAAALSIAGADTLARALTAYDDRVDASHVEIVGPFEVAICPPGSIELPARDPTAAIDPDLDGLPHGARLVGHLRAALGGRADF